MLQSATTDDHAPGAHTDVKGMFDRIAGRYDTANRVMSGGVDILWRRRAMGPLLTGLPQNATLLDLGAGTLDGSIEMARRLPGARVAGADFAKQMLKVGAGKLGTLGTRVAPHGADGHHLPYGRQVFDAAFTAFCVRNLADLPQALGELRRVLRPGAPLVVLEFFRPTKPRFFFDKLWNPHVLPLLGRMVTGDKDAYRYLPESIGRFLSRTEFEDRLRAAGFATVTGEDLFPSGVASLVVAR